MIYFGCFGLSESSFSLSTFFLFLLWTQLSRNFEAMSGLVAQAWDLAIVPVFAGLCPHNGFKKEQAGRGLVLPSRSLLKASLILKIRQASQVQIES